MPFSKVFADYSEQLPGLRKMAKEFIETASSLNSQEWIALLAQVAVKAGKETVRTKVQAINDGVRFSTGSLAALF
ncbi:MAG TPA: hypothetical protein VIM29_01645 [Bacillota bacterium]